METKYKAGLSILGISSLALLTVAAVFNTSRFEIHSSVRGDNTKTTTVTQSMLDATTLYDYDLGGPNGKDSKFSINLVFFHEVNVVDLFIPFGSNHSVL